MTYRNLFICILSCLILVSCKQDVQNNSKTAQAIETPEVLRKPGDFSLPDWAISANLYEVNLRQYTKEGTFNAFAKHLPRLKEMGVDILWFMPIFPISTTKRKGTLGSYYAVSDFKAVNPEFGTMKDFENMVREIHAHGMHLILDWVPNHTGWDHKWLSQHKDWFTQDSLGKVIDPIDPGTGKSWGWTDVADLNYDKEEMRAEMIKDMSYWVTEKKIDGFRMDVAHNVPDDFWREVRDALFSYGRPLFMLAEAEMENHRNRRYFHAGYGWSMHHVLNEIARGKKKPSYIDTLLKQDKKKYNKGFNIQFTSNHDENAWSGTVMERMGPAHKTFAALTATLDGMPLVYGGQEEPVRKRLEFFEKDDIGFEKYEYADFYKRLNKLKHENPAIWNGHHGGEVRKMLVDNDSFYGFIRYREGYKVIGLFNLTDQKISVELPVGIKGIDVLTDENIRWTGENDLQLMPWQFYLIKNK